MQDFVETDLLLTIFLVGCDWSQNSVALTQQDLDRIATILNQDRLILTTHRESLHRRPHCD